MISARIRAELPPGIWIADVSTNAPDATFRLLAGLRADDTAIELGEASGSEPADVAAAIETHDSILAFDVLEETEDRVLAKYETTDTALYELVASSSLPIEYPVVVRNGWYELDVTGTREQFDQLKAMLEAADRPFELLSLVHETDATDLVTDRQREVLSAALRKGYFSVPRDCSLADLAAALDLDKSTTSRILRRGEARVLQQFLTAPDW